MSKEKSSAKDTIINVVLIIASAGVIFYRYRDCKQKELEAQQKSTAVQEDAARKEKARFNKCLEGVPEQDRNECMQCMCKGCIDPVEACRNNSQCKGLTPADLGKDAGADGGLGQILYDTQANCMVRNCFTQCVSGKGSK